MTRFTVEIECDNEAFSGNPLEEVARLLRVAATKCADGREGGSLMDANGNRVGYFELYAFEPDQGET